MKHKKGPITNPTSLTLQLQPTPASVYQVPSLKPIYLSFRVQHELTKTVQTTLEEAIFDFVKKSIPQLLVEFKWDTAKAGELNAWGPIIDQFTASYESGKQVKPYAEVCDLIAKVKDIRHITVHRIPTPAMKIEKLTEDAIVLARALQDDPRSAQLRQILKALTKYLNSMAISQHTMENQLGPTLQNLQDKKDRMIASIDREADTVISNARMDDDKANEECARRLEMFLESLSQSPSSIPAPNVASIPTAMDNHVEYPGVQCPEGSHASRALSKQSEPRHDYLEHIDGQLGNEESGEKRQLRLNKTRSVTCSRNVITIIDLTAASDDENDQPMPKKQKPDKGLADGF